MKSTIILLHGALGSSDQLNPIRDLLEIEFDVHSFSFSGHGGKTFNTSGFSVPVFVEEVRAFMDDNDIVKAHFFGYSMGGYVALKLAKKYPENVDKIFTLATKFNWSAEEAQKEVKNLNPAIIQEKIPKFAAMLEQLHTPNDWKEVLNRTAQLMIDLGDHDRLSGADLASITNDCMVSIGTEDMMVTLEESKNTASILPNGYIQVFEGLKHPIEQADSYMLTEKIKRFFTSDLL